MPKYKPGSFSKNFAWHGTGLRKLYDAIHSGYKSKPEPVERDTFRQRCGIPDEFLQLIPINFFLYNTVKKTKCLLVVDELVFQALAFPHSIEFDRLALFTLHLSRTGKHPQGGVDSEHPSQWIREFVEQDLWTDGWWRTDRLDKQHMDNFIVKVLDAEDEVRIKCRRNYRHLFELCQYLPAQGDLIDSGADEWMGSALFLAWDRESLELEVEQTPNKDQLLKYVHDEQLYKLMGVPEEAVSSYAAQIVSTYIDAGGVSRFSSKFIEIEISESGPHVEGKPRKHVAVPEKAIVLENIENEQRTEIARQKREYEAQIRDWKLCSDMKKLYEFTCMFCGERLQVRIIPQRYYVECAHIKPVGKPDNGPDVASNMLVLCPNHHRQFDNGVLVLERVSVDGLRILARVNGHPLHKRAIRLRPGHKIDNEFLQWHMNKADSKSR